MHRRVSRIASVFGVGLAALLVLAPAGNARAASARWAFETAYGDGEWYRGKNNEDATLAWGESYVMMALASMYRATDDRRYLDELAAHADDAMAQRDDARGVADYRGVSTACWRNTSYQDQPYCYVVHSGMIAYPVAELVRLIRSRPEIADLTTYDGTTYADKATALLAAVEEVVAAHDDQFVPSGSAGNYIFRADASFLDFAGQPMPLNQQNAMGRLLFALWQITGNTTYEDKARRLAVRFRSAISTGGSGEYLWNYWGDAYASPGEDISHAGINVGFAVLAADLGIEFDDADVEALTRTFVVHVYIDDATLSNNVGGGDVNGSSYKPQAGRWLVLSRKRSTIYQVVRNYYETAIDPAGVGSGSVLLGWAYLAEYEPPLCEHFFYHTDELGFIDWQDQGAHMQATAYGANILTTPPDPSLPCMVPLRFAANRAVTVAQWDGSQYHANAVWRATGGSFVDRLLAYEPRWHFVYHDGGDLFELEDEFVSGDGVRVMKPVGLNAPAITSTPDQSASPGVPYAYDSDDGLPEATGDAPLWWSLASGPAAARVDPATGAIEWTPAATGSIELSLRVENDVGADEQTFTVEVQGPAADAGATADAASGPDAGIDAGGSIDSGDGCDCTVEPGRDAPPSGWLVVAFGVFFFLRVGSRRTGRRKSRPRSTRRSSPPPRRR